MASCRRIPASYLERLPTTVNGIALGAAGIAGTFGALSEHAGHISSKSYSAEPALLVVSEATQWISYGLFCVSGLVMMIYPFKTALAPKVVLDELTHPHTVAALAPIAIAGNFVAAKLTDIPSTFTFWAGYGLVLAAAALQVVMMALFLSLSFFNKYYPEPAWFPPTVSIGGLAFTGRALGLPQELILTSFCLGVVVKVIVLPIAAWRSLRPKSQVALAPGICILMAPASYTAGGWYSFQGYSSEYAWIPHTVSALSAMFFFLTLIGIAQRWRHIFLKPFNPTWAAFTFPIASTATVANKYFIFCSRNGVWEGWTYTVQFYAIVVSVIAVIVVPLVIVVYLCHLPVWLKEQGLLYGEQFINGFEVLELPSVMEDPLLKKSLQVKGWSIRTANMWTSANAINSIGPLVELERRDVSTKPLLTNLSGRSAGRQASGHHSSFRNRSMSLGDSHTEPNGRSASVILSALETGDDSGLNDREADTGEMPPTPHAEVQAKISRMASIIGTLDKANDPVEKASGQAGAVGTDGVRRPSNSKKRGSRAGK